MESGTKPTVTSSLRIELNQSQDKKTTQNKLSVIQVPMKVDIKTFTFMNDSGTKLEEEETHVDAHKPNTFVSASDSGFDQSEAEGETPIRTVKQHEGTKECVVTSQLHSKSKSFIQTKNLDLHVQDKSTVEDLSSQRFNERNVLAKKISENLSNGGTPKYIQLKENTDYKNESNSPKSRIKVRSCQSRTKRKQIGKDNNQLQYQIPKGKQEVKSADHLRNSLSDTKTDNDWERLQSQLNHLQSQGYDANVALWAMVSSFSNSETPRILDWRQLAKKMGKDPVSMDFFSIYPWSMRKKDHTNTRLGEYLQTCVQENQVEQEEQEHIFTHRKPPKGDKRVPNGPIGIKYTKSPRGFTKKEKSKTPGEVAIDEARHKNSKLYKGARLSVDSEEISFEKPKTSHSLPNIAYFSPASSSHSRESSITLPNIHPTRSVKPNNGKIYSGIYRLATPPDKTRNLTSQQNLQESITYKSSPLQVKTCGIPNSQPHLIMTPQKPKTTVESDSDDCQLPLIYDYRYENANATTDEPFIVHSLVGRKNKDKQEKILKNMYEKTAYGPPNPPPVTPHAWKGRQPVRQDEMNVYMIKYQRIQQTQTPLGSRRSSCFPDTESSSDSELNSETSSIHSLSVNSKNNDY